MIIYNVTVLVESGIAADWLAWMKDVHIPEVLHTKCFSGYKIVRLLDIDETDGPTYAIQFEAESKADYNRYVELFAPALQEKSSKAWGERFHSFRSVMQVVH
jgi:hypothetical protein